MKHLKNCLIASLIFVFAFGMFSLTGCGKVDLGTVAQNYEQLQQTYDEYKKVFDLGADGTGVIFDGIKTKYKIKTYGDVVDAQIIGEKNNTIQNVYGFKEFEQLYNCVLVISSQYIDNNISYVTTLEETPKGADDIIAKLSESLTSYKEYIPVFVKAKEDFTSHFETFGLSNEAEVESYVRSFSQVFGTLVSKNIEISVNLAAAVESTGIFDVLQEISQTTEVTRVFKEYIRAKLLPIYTRFYMDEVLNKFNWQGTTETPDKQEIQKILDKTKENFDVFKDQFVLRPENDLKELDNSKENPQLSNLFDMSEVFFQEAENFYVSAKNFDVMTFANPPYKNNLDEYMLDNSYAKIYLSKMTTFVNVTVPAFVNKIVSEIYR